MLNAIAYYARAAWGVQRFLREPPIADPEAAVRAQLARRDTSFLQTVRSVLARDAEHPYRHLFRGAGCTLGDLERSIRQDGLEGTLARLYRAGVYVTHDEFKGKRRLERPGVDLALTPERFTNPLVRGALEMSTSGSRSPGTKTLRSLEFLRYRDALDALTLRCLDLHQRPQVDLYHSLPAMSGLQRTLAAARYGAAMERWFTVGGTTADARVYQVMTRALVLEARLLRTPTCGPTYLPPNDFRPVAEWLARRRNEGAPCLVLGGVSRSVRVAAAATEHDLDISGTAFVVSGEALTRAKRAVIERAGAEAVSAYVIAEMGPVGIGCRNLRLDNAVHVTRDTVAVISRERLAPLSGTLVESLLFTTLLPWAPLLLVNVEMDDAGHLETVACDCLLGALGYSQRIRELHSYGKLTGQSATLEGSELLRVLEELLPQRFGGNPTDYQLVEREGRRQTEIELRVNPRLAGVSDLEVRRFFLDQVRLLWGGSLMRREWIHSEAFRVVLAEPLATSTGKILALHLLGESQRGPDLRLR